MTVARLLLLWWWTAGLVSLAEKTLGGPCSLLERVCLSNSCILGAAKRRRSMCLELNRKAANVTMLE